MGLFNWAMKGVRVEKRTPETRAGTAVMEVPQPFGVQETYFPQPAGQQPQVQTQTSAQKQAQTLLFNQDFLTPSPSPATTFSSNPFQTANNNPFQNSNPSPFQSSSPNPFQPTNHFQNAMSGHNLSSRNILLLTPRTKAEIQQIVDNLQSNEACIVNLEGVAVAEAQRMLDFLSGVICAMNGSIKPLDPNKYILTPSGLGVKPIIRPEH